MNWEPFSLHFKQKFEGGYRYLDRCGEFISVLESLGLMADSAVPTGAKLVIPELGITAIADASQLAIVQEACGSSHNTFLDTCIGVSKKYIELFTPSRVESNGFAMKSFLRYASIESAAKHSLKLGDEYIGPLSKVVEMVPSEKRLDYHFVSGSQNLHIVAHPLTFTSITRQSYTAGAHATDSLKKRIERMNQGLERLDSTLSHAVMLEIDLVENNPPEGVLSTHFSALETKVKRVQDELSKF